MPFSLTFHQTLAISLHNGFCHKPIFDISAVYINKQSVGPVPGKVRRGGMDGNMGIFLFIFSAQYGVAGLSTHEEGETQKGVVGCGKMKYPFFAVFQAKGNVRKRHGGP